MHEIGGALLQVWDVERGGALLVAMRTSRPDVTMQEMCDMLEEMHAPTPRGRETWHPSAVKPLLDRAERLGHACQQGTLATSRGGSDDAVARSVAGR